MELLRITLDRKQQPSRLLLKELWPSKIWDLFHMSCINPECVSVRASLCVLMFINISVWHMCKDHAENIELLKAQCCFLEAMKQSKSFQKNTIPNVNNLFLKTGYFIRKILIVGLFPIIPILASYLACATICEKKPTIIFQTSTVFILFHRTM